MRVAQNGKARKSWITLFTTGSLRQSYDGTMPTNTHSSTHTNSSGHTGSTGDTPPKSILSSALKSEHKFIRGFSNKHGSISSTPSVTHTCSTVSSASSARRSRISLDGAMICHRKSMNGYGHKRSSSGCDAKRRESMSDVVGRFMGRIRSKSHCGIDHQVAVVAKGQRIQSRRASEGCKRHFSAQKVSRNHSFFEPSKTLAMKDSFSQVLKDPSPTTNRKDPWDDVVSELASESFNRSSRPRSLFAMKFDKTTNFMSENQSSSLHPHQLGFPNSFNPQINGGPKSSDHKVPQSLVPTGTCRSLGSLMASSSMNPSIHKEGDDSSWHFVRQPPDGMSAPVNEGEVSSFKPKPQLAKSEETNLSDNDAYTSFTENPSNEIKGANLTNNNCGVIVLAGQRIVTNQNTAHLNLSHKGDLPLPRAASHNVLGSPVLEHNDFRARRSSLGQCISTENMSPNKQKRDSLPHI